jgi:hypothetical protein
MRVLQHHRPGHSQERRFVFVAVRHLRRFHVFWDDADPGREVAKADAGGAGDGMTAGEGNAAANADWQPLGDFVTREPFSAEVQAWATRIGFQSKEA